MSEAARADPATAWDWIRSGRWTGVTAGLAAGYAQANLVVLPATHAGDFLEFCRRNPRPCPVIDWTGPGNPVPARAGPRADLRTDLPRYRIWAGGQLAAEVRDLRSWWREDLVAVLLGCSFTFERALLAAGVPVRHQEQGCNVPMYVSSLQCVPAGPFSGPVVVSMRPVPAELVATAVAATARYTGAHGAPLHAGDPGAIGIRDLSAPDFGDPVAVHPGEVPLFWACGVTSHLALMSAKLPLAITHAPGHMFVTGLRDEELTRWRAPARGGTIPGQPSGPYP